MTSHYTELISDLSIHLNQLRADLPEVMQKFKELNQAAAQEGALSTKTKELIALGIAVAARCPGCIGFHSKALVKLGASLKEVEETLAMAIYMGGGPSVMYAAEALKAFKEFSGP